MATHDYIISNASGAAVRADLNNALAAIVSNNSNATSPTTTYAYQWWADTTTGQLKLRNSSNSAWITIFELDGTMLMEDGTVSAPGLAFASDLNTGFFRSAADKINFATGGAERLEIGSSEVVFNDPGNDVDFRVESNGNSHMLFVEAGINRVGVGTNSPAVLLDVADSSGNEPKLRMSTGTATNFFQISRSSSTGHYTLASEENGSSIILATDPDGTGAVNRLTVDRNGRVGIGVTPSSSPLEILSGTSNSSLIEGSGAAAGRGIKISTYANTANDAGVLIEAPYATYGQLAFGTAGSEAARIDSSGRLLVGTASDVSGGLSTTLIQGVASGGGYVGLARNDTSVADGNGIGGLRFYANDPSAYNDVGIVQCVADGTHATNDYPTRLEFHTTADGASSPTERMRISNTGNIKLTGGEALFWDDAGDRYIACIGDATSNINLHGRANVIFKTGGSSYDGGTERARVTSNGLTFNGDTAAANALDDYEEGTFTPAFQAGTFTYGNVDGRYVKIGQQVTAHYLVSWSSKSGTGTLQVNLPFATGGNAHSRFCGALGYLEGIDNGGNKQLTSTVSGNGSTAVSIFIINDNAAPSNTLVQNLSSSGELQMSISYIV